MLSDQALIDIAGIIGESGTCTRLQVGAILTMSRRIISTGYNGAPSGMDHCVHKPEDRLTLVEQDKGCLIAVHAEANVIAFAAKYGVTTWYSVLYTTHSPCVTCARLLINARIKEVIYEHEYRDTRGLDELAKAGVKVTGPLKSGLSALSTPRGDPKGMYPSERTYQRFKDPETADTPDTDR